MREEAEGRKDGEGTDRGGGARLASQEWVRWVAGVGLGGSSRGRDMTAEVETRLLART